MGHETNTGIHLLSARELAEGWRVIDHDRRDFGDGYVAHVALVESPTTTLAYRILLARELIGRREPVILGRLRVRDAAALRETATLLDSLHSAQLGGRDGVSR